MSSTSLPAIFMSLRLRMPVCALAVLALAAGAAAPVDAQGSDWTWTVAPYLWGSGLSGNVGVIPGVPPANVDVSFSQLLENLDFGVMAVVNANNGQYGFSADLIYAKMSAGSQSLAPLWSQADVKVEQTILTLLGEYNLSTGPGHELWATGGLRYWDIGMAMNLLPGVLPARAGSVRDNWVDPVIGLRGRQDLGERTFLTGWAYVGGFGVGSDEMADLFGGVGYAFSDSVSGVLGYRWMSVDRVDGAFIYDTVQQGLITGVAFRF